MFVSFEFVGFVVRFVFRKGAGVTVNHRLKPQAKDWLNMLCTTCQRSATDRSWVFTLLAFATEVKICTENVEFEPMTMQIEVSTDKYWDSAGKSWF